MYHAEKLFLKAHELHYTNNDLVSAFEIYQEIISSYPNSPQANYSKNQIRHIENNKRLPEQMEKQLRESQEAELINQQNQERKRITESGDAFLYEKFTKEIEIDDFDRAVWSKALAIHYGDKDKAKYEYVKLKVDDVKARLGLPGVEFGGIKNNPKVAVSSSKPTTRSDITPKLDTNTKSNPIAMGLEPSQSRSEPSQITPPQLGEMQNFNMEESEPVAKNQKQSEGFSKHRLQILSSWIVLIIVVFIYANKAHPYTTGIDFISTALGAVIGAWLFGAILFGLTAVVYRAVSGNKMQGFTVFVPLIAAVLVILILVSGVYV